MGCATTWLNKYLLLTEFEGHTASYRPRFSPSMYVPSAKRAGHKRRGIKGSLSSSWMNSPMPSLLLPLWQNESLSETIGMKIDVTCTVIRMKIK